MTNFTRQLASLLAALAALGLTACDRSSDPTTIDSPTTPPATTAAPLPSQPAAASSQPASSEPREMTWVNQRGWTEETPSNAMRIAQYLLPKAMDEDDDANLVVYFFPSGGGPVEANITRWCSQFTVPGVPNPREAAEVEEVLLGGIPITIVDLEGRFVAETTPGSGVRVDKPEYRMLAAIVQSNPGPYYVKLVGPKLTIEYWEDSFHSFLEAAVE